MHQNNDPFLQGWATERKHMAWVAGIVTLSVPSPVPPEQSWQPCRACTSCLAQSMGRIGVENEGAHIQSCSGRNWKALASAKTSNQPSSAEVMAPLLRAFFQVEAPLCFAVGLEKSAVACAQRKGSFIREESERYLEPVVGEQFSCKR